MEISSDALLKPQAYFERQTGFSPLVPVGILGLVIVLRILGGIIASFGAGAGTGEGLITGGIGSVFAIGGALVFETIWFLFYFGAMFLLAYVLADDAPDAVVVASVVAVGYIPKAFQGLVGILEGVWILVKNLLGMGLGVGFIGEVLISVSAIVMFVWGAYIWFGGIRATQNLEAAKAAVVVGVPAAVGFAVLMIGVLGRVIGGAFTSLGGI